MGKPTDSNGASQGALVVVLGMIIGAMLILVVQRYTTLEKRKTAKELYDLYETKRS